MGLHKWLLSIAFKKGVKRAVSVLVAWLIANGLSDWGVTLDVEQLTLASLVGVEALRNYLKHERGMTWL